jgi:hypothetical protein
MADRLSSSTAAHCTTSERANVVALHGFELI